MRGTASIPPIESLNYPVDIYIRIYREGSRYAMEIHGVGKTLKAPIELSSNDLVPLNKDLQAAMESVSEHSTSRELEERLYQLAKVGHYAFKRVFSNSDALAVMQNFLSINQMLSIEIASEDFSLPWELMHPASLEKPQDYASFWGLTHIVSRVIVQRDRPGAFVSPTIQVASLPKLGLLSCEKLPGVRKTEIPFFEQLAADGKIALLRLRALEAADWQEEFKEFKNFWLNEFDLAHFACHALFNNESPPQSYIEISNDFRITLMDMDVYGLVIDGYPLIVMNACETGNLNPLYTSYYAAAFLKYGARGVVASECTVPDAFAASFAEQLYTRLLAGECLGNSLLACRRYFLQQHNDPSGLLYSMYAPPTIRFKIGDGR